MPERKWYIMPNEGWKMGVCVLTRAGEVIPGTHQVTQWRLTMVGNQAIVDLKHPPLWDPAPRGATHMAVLDPTTSKVMFHQELPNGETVGNERISFREKG
jgi:hypothetical protein